MRQTGGIERGLRGKVYTCAGFNSDGGCATSGYFVYGEGTIPLCVLCRNLMTQAQCEETGCTQEATRINVEVRTGLILARCECH